MKFWIYINGEVPGSFTPAELAALPGFSAATLTCPAEGEIAEKNWRPAGDFGEIAAALSSRKNETAASDSAAAPRPTDVNALIDETGAKLLGHLSALIEELEARRGDRAVILSLERRISALKEELGQARERTSRAEQALVDMRASAEKLKAELDGTKRRLQESIGDLALRNRLIDTLSKEMADKELSLAKSLGVVQRLEENLGRLRADHEPPAVPAAAPTTEPSIASLPESDSQETAVLPSFPAPYTVDEPPTAPPYLEPTPPERSKAQQALADFLKRLLPEQPN